MSIDARASVGGLGTTRPDKTLDLRASIAAVGLPCIIFIEAFAEPAKEVVFFELLTSHKIDCVLFIC